MPERVEKAELIRRVAERTDQDRGTIEEIVDGVLEEMYEAFKRGESISLRNFGAFYVRPERTQWVFRFNPAQRLRKLFGWSSTYRGDM